MRRPLTSPNEEKGGNSRVGRGCRERGRTGESAFGVPFRRFSSFSFFLPLQKPPAKSCSLSSDYVVIGLFYEPCDAVLSIPYTIPNCVPLLPS